jgi:hypothetical protein
MLVEIVWLVWKDGMGLAMGAEPLRTAVTAVDQAVAACCQLLGEGMMDCWGWTHCCS